MGAYVFPTDLSWFEFLLRRNVDEVNFWLPTPWGGTFRALKRGEPLLFKLKAPYNAIAGGGYFELYTEFPISVAWEIFAEKNGASSLDEVRASIAPLRRREKSDDREDFKIGCILLVEPFFWPREMWIPAPEDFHVNTVRGKRYEFDSPSGSRLWAAVSERLQPRRSDGSDELDALPTLIVPGGYGDPTLVPRRLGQGTFRAMVTDAYGRQCAITRERTLPALDAVHIRPFSSVETHHIRNGLLLRSDLHRLFDAGYITVMPDYTVKASSRMRRDFNGGDSYLQLDGASINVPAMADQWPDPEALRWHNENRFRS